MTKNRDYLAGGGVEDEPVDVDLGLSWFASPIFKSGNKHAASGLAEALYRLVSLGFRQCLTTVLDRRDPNS